MVTRQLQAKCGTESSLVKDRRSTNVQRNQPDGPKSPNERGNVTFAGHLKTRHGRSMSPTVVWPCHVVSCDVTMEVSAAEDNQLEGARGTVVVHDVLYFVANVLQHVLMLGFSWHLLTDSLYLACAACLPGGPYVLLALITAAEGKAIIFYRCNLFIFFISPA